MANNALNAGSAYWDLDLDDSAFKRKVKESSGAIAGIKGGFEAAEESSQKLAAALGVVAVGLGGLAAKAISAASETQETFSKFATVFSSVKDEADAVAENLVNNFGLSRLAAKQLLSGTGDLLTGFGFTGKAALGISKQVNELAVDLASFTNATGGAQAVSDALTKALLGEREALKTYGIAILEADIDAELLRRGQNKLTGETLRQAKAQITLDLAMRQSKNAMGDFARTSDSFANRSRVLNARIEDLVVSIGGIDKDGKLKPGGLLDIATRIAGELIKAFESLSSEIDKAGGFVEYITKIFNENQQTIYVVAGAISVALLPALAGLAAATWGALAPLLPFLAAGAALGYLVNELVKKFGGWEPLLNKVKDALQGLWNAIAPVLLPILESLRKEFTERLLPALKALWDLIAPVLLPVLQFLAQVIGTILVVAILAVIEAFKNFVSWISGVLTFIANLGLAIRRWFESNSENINKFVEWVKGGFAQVGAFIQGLIDKFNEIVGKIGAALAGIFDVITKPFRDAFNEITKKFDEVKAGFESMVNTLSFKGDQLTKKTKEIGDASKFNMSNLNPLQRHSPSLVDWIRRGTDEISKLYAEMYTGLNAMSMDNKLALNGAAQSLSASTQGSGTMAAAPITNNINLSGIMSRSQGELRDIAGSLLEAMNQTQRAKGAKEIG